MLTKGMKRAIRKNAHAIKRELDYHKGTGAEYAKVPYPAGKDYFVCYRADYNEAMEGLLEGKIKYMVMRDFLRTHPAFNKRGRLV